MKKKFYQSYYLMVNPTAKIFYIGLVDDNSTPERNFKKVLRHYNKAVFGDSNEDCGYAWLSSNEFINITSDYLSFEARAGVNKKIMMLVEDDYDSYDVARMIQFVQENYSNNYDLSIMNRQKSYNQLAFMMKLKYNMDKNSISTEELLKIILKDDFEVAYE